MANSVCATPKEQRPTFSTESGIFFAVFPRKMKKMRRRSRRLEKLIYIEFWDKINDFLFPFFSPVQ
jgi:hypothetical protein